MSWNLEIALKVFLASTGFPPEYSCIPMLQDLAAHDRFGLHALTDDEGDADLILFTDCHLSSDWRLREISQSQLVRHHRDKCYVWDQRDRPWCVLPGLVVSMPKRSFRNDFQRAWSYFPLHEPFTRLGLTAAPSTRPDLLFSFVGTRTHRCRDPLFLLEHDRAVIEEVKGFLFHDPSSADFEARRSRFAEVLYRSKFILCPRGHGTSSFRLYETMASGRVPVIISDDWVAPSGPDWASISIRWPESGYAELIAHLEQIESEAEPMGSRARAAFLEFFAADTAFHRAAETLSELHLARNGRRFPAHGLRGRRFWELKLADARGRVRATRLRLRARSDPGVPETGP